MRTPIIALLLIIAVVVLACSTIDDEALPGDPFGPCSLGVGCAGDDATCLHVGPAAVCSIACDEVAECTLVLQPTPVPFGADLTCADHLCVVRCVSDADCPGAMTCAGSTCAWEDPS